MAEQVAGGVQKVADTAWWHTKVQWGVVGAFLVGVGTFVNASINKLDIVNTAMASAQIQGTTNAAEIVVVKQRVESIDSGVGQKIQQLENKIDAYNKAAQQERAEDRALMQAILREARK